MGAAHSAEPRSVTMDNPHPADVVSISDDVVKRLKEGMSRQARENATVDASIPQSRKTTPVESLPSASPATAASVAQPAVVYPNPTPIYVTGGGHTLTAADVRRQMEGELQKNDEVWRQRLAKLEEDLKKTNSVMESEYATAVEDVRKRFVTTSAGYLPPPCPELKAQLLGCYRANAGQTLKCTQEVEDFRNCVDSHRIRKLQGPEQSAAAPSAPVTENKSMPAKAG